jgi:hypothetical protein
VKRSISTCHENQNPSFNQHRLFCYHCSIYSAGNQLLIRNTFTVNRALFVKEEYKGLKSFFEKVYALINEQVVLKRKL